jgi:hypothetical protein
LQVIVNCSGWVDNSGAESPLEYLIYIVDGKTLDSFGVPKVWYPVYSGTRASATFYLSPFDGVEGDVDIRFQVTDSLGSKNSTLLR